MTNDGRSASLEQETLNMPKHTDGTECLEGTTKIPKDFKPCCDVFDAHISSCAYDLRYEWWQKMKIWVIVISETAGGGGIAISFCPHCGSRLSEKSKS
jgi:hypothetical protein